MGHLLYYRKAFRCQFFNQILILWHNFAVWRTQLNCTKGDKAFIWAKECNSYQKLGVIKVHQHPHFFQQAFGSFLLYVSWYILSFNMTHKYLHILKSILHFSAETKQKFIQLFSYLKKILFLLHWKPMTIYLLFLVHWGIFRYIFCANKKK